MLTNHIYTHTDGVVYRAGAWFDESPKRYTPPGYTSDNPFPRNVGWYQVVDTGHYTSPQTGTKVYTLIFEAQGDIDSMWGYTIMTPDPRFATYTNDQQDALIKAIHAAINAGLI